MIRTANVVEKNIRPDPASPIAIQANTSTQILEELSGTKYACIEYSGRYIFNDTGATIYYAFGQDCSPVSYHGRIQDQQQLDCSNHGASVTVYGPNAGNVIPSLLRRKDLSEHIIIQPNDQLS